MDTMKNNKTITFQKKGEEGKIRKIGTFYEVEIKGMKFMFNEEELKNFMKTDQQKED